MSKAFHRHFIGLFIVLSITYKTKKKKVTCEIFGTSLGGQKTEPCEHIRQLRQQNLKLGIVYDIRNIF